LKFIFRRTVNTELMNQWLEIVQVASCLHYSEDDDAMVWQYDSSEKFSVQSLYAIVSDRGVKQIFTPVMWKILVRSRLHVFLWLLVNNKVLTSESPLLSTRGG
jgi:hypothetical protein